jgi:hypothetical protein
MVYKEETIHSFNLLSSSHFSAVFQVTPIRGAAGVVSNIVAVVVMKILEVTTNDERWLGVKRILNQHLASLSRHHHRPHLNLLLIKKYFIR